LGINFFDDVAWFNKEGFEAALFYGVLFFLLETGQAETIAELAAAFARAEEASGYRLDGLLDSLSGGGGPDKTYKKPKEKKKK
jgi:hypothetical protein